MLALVQLKQFKVSEKELNDKIKNLETLLVTKSQQQVLENTSKFGTGSLVIEEKPKKSDSL